jgi:hypothetical protein
MDIIESHKNKLNASFTATLCNITGALVCISLISYFLIMRLMGFHEIIFLRVFNFIFLFAGIIIALHRYSRNYDGTVEFFKGFRIGMHVTGASVIPFALFMLIYLSIDKSLMNTIINSVNFGNYITPGSAAVVIIVEGIASGLIMTLISMQYFKKS